MTHTHNKVGTHEENTLVIFNTFSIITMILI